MSGTGANSNALSAAEKADLQPIADAACRSHITYEPGYYEQQIQSCAVAMLSDAQLYALMDELRRSFQYPPVNDKPGVIIKTPELYGLCLRTVPSLDPMTGEQEVFISGAGGNNYGVPKTKTISAWYKRHADAGTLTGPRVEATTVAQGKKNAGQVTPAHTVFSEKAVATSVRAAPFAMPTVTDYHKSVAIVVLCDRQTDAARLSAAIDSVAATDPTRDLARARAKLLALQAAVDTSSAPMAAAGSMASAAALAASAAGSAASAAASAASAVGSVASAAASAASVTGSAASAAASAPSPQNAQRDAKRQRVVSPSWSTAAASDGSTTGDQRQFDEAVGSANSCRTKWKIKDQIEKFWRDGCDLYALDINQTTDRLVGKLVPSDETLPRVQILFDLSGTKYEVPDMEVHLMDACQLVAHKIKGGKASGAIADLIERIEDARQLCQEELQAYRDGIRAYKVLTRPAAERLHDAFRDCTTLNLMGAFRYLIEGYDGEFIKRSPVKSKNVEPRISAADGEGDPESTTVCDPVAMVSSNLVLVAVRELLTLNGRAVRKAMKLHFKHVLCKVEFAVWVPIDTINLMKTVPAYRTIFDATDYERLCHNYTLKMADLAVGKRLRPGEYSYGHFDPAAYGDKWPIPMPVTGSHAHAHVLGPVTVPKLTDQSDSFVKFLHLMKTTADKRHTAGDRYDEPSYVTAYNCSLGLMVAEGQSVPSKLLTDTYRNFCGRNHLTLVDDLAITYFGGAGTTLVPSAPGYLMKFNLAFEPSKDTPDFGKVWGIGFAPRPLIPERLPSTPQDLEVLDLAAKGWLSCPKQFLPPGVEPTSEAARQLLHGIATNTTPLLQYNSGDDGVPAQEHARALLELAGPSASGEPMTDGSTPQ